MNDVDLHGVNDLFPLFCVRISTIYGLYKSFFFKYNMLIYTERGMIDKINMFWENIWTT